MKALTGSQSRIAHVDPVALHGKLFSEAPEKIPDASKIKQKLGWKPTKGIDDVIKEVVEFWSNQ